MYCINYNLTFLFASRFKVSSKVNDISAKYIEQLTEYWRKTFNEDIVQQNLNKLINHVEVFYQDVQNETIDRQNRIIKFIKGKYSIYYALLYIIKLNK